MKHQLIWLFILSIAISACGGSAPESTTPSSKLTITGSSTIAPVIAEIAKAYESKHPQVRIDVQTGGSSRGLNDVIQGTADIGMVSKHLTATAQYQPHLLGRDGVTVIVHQDNPLASLDKQTIQAIYTKSINDWKELGLSAGEIVVVSKAEGRSTLAVFLNFLGLKNSQLRPDSIIGDNEQAVKLVASNPKAIAYVSTSTAYYNSRDGVPIRAVAINDIYPSLENVSAGTFPIVRELNLILPDMPSRLAQSFVQFARSPDAQDIIRGFNFVPAI